MKSIIVQCSIVLSILSLASCKEPKEITLDVDKQLFELVRDTLGNVRYKDSLYMKNDSTLSTSHIDSLKHYHSTPYISVRYNNVAKASLTSTTDKNDANYRRVSENAVFANNSMIILEEMSDTHTVVKYSIMYKSGNKTNADLNGWIWAQYYADGRVMQSPTKKGEIDKVSTYNCNFCHGKSGHINFTLTNSAK
jgi:hypothetical protein